MGTVNLADPRARFSGHARLEWLPPDLDWDTCDRARSGRDRAFDGAFFTGVRTTRIYCRPVCLVRPARSAKSCFFDSAAAERAGFRPCLRCRPETAPGSPAWNGTATTVARAMRTDRGRIPGRSLSRGTCRATARRATPPVTGVFPSYRREPKRYCCDATRTGGEAVDRSNDNAGV
ncbi:MAG TPA: Ada metal-binding domain-containing protein [Terracidiphilus sp.]